MRFFESIIDANHWAVETVLTVSGPFWCFAPRQAVETAATNTSRHTD
jgi:hypothetical protein